ncbi:hypothetical protein [Kineococcus sp. SYSU DK005]|uniref:hypothetical protein n=1 Tax=Kineococcus sp. SYSU DK005 TaxID=3383126 RepID=UPI003D7EC448
MLARVFSPVLAQVDLHGFLDLAQRRAQLAGRCISVLHSGERMRSGRPGRLLATLEPEPASARTSPLEVFDWLAASSDVIFGDTRADADDETGNAPEGDLAGGADLAPGPGAVGSAARSGLTG